MDWVGTVLKILEAGLSIWKDKEAGKYLDEVIEIKKTIQEEKNKPAFIPGMKNGTFRNDAIVDHCERRLRIIADAFASASRGA